MSSTVFGQGLAAETREFLHGDYTRQQLARNDRKAFARNLAVRMSEGEEFDIKTFLFAVSLGEPQKYEDEETMLWAAQHLEQGTIVAVARLGKISCVGTVGENPLRMLADVRVRGDRIDHHNRRFNASLLFTRLFPTSMGTPASAYAPEIHGSGVDLAPHAMTLLSSIGETDPHSSRSAFSVSNELIVGASNIIESLIDNPENHGKTLVANFIDELADASLATQ